MHNEVTTNRLVFTLAEIGQLLGGVSPRTVYKYTHGGGLRAISVCGRPMVRKADLDAFLASREPVVA